MFQLTPQSLASLVVSCGADHFPSLPVLAAVELMFRWPAEVLVVDAEKK